MSQFLEEITDELTLQWAWEKVRREATPGDDWFDEIELAGFELELERNLQDIAAEFRKGRYRLAPLRPLPFPKNPDKEGKPQIRQVFQVSVRDQVAWTAVVNVVGPHVDEKMPAWSYGNRLFRSIWVEEDDAGRKRRKIGRYRHASGQLYLPFAQSWPIFRRHVCLSIRAMTTAKPQPQLDERTEEEYELQRWLTEEHRCPFVMPEYWKGRRPRRAEPRLYWCGLDLKKFYPTTRLRVVRENIVEQLPADWRDEASQLLRSMCAFHLDLDKWEKDDLRMMDIIPGSRSFSCIPTGLHVAGFLANAALLKVDMEVSRRLKGQGVAHFRYVDDHIVLAYSFEELQKWVEDYVDLLSKAGTGAEINLDKVEPKEFAEYLSVGKANLSRKKYSATRKAAERKCHLDPQFPSPLMTKTLVLVSGIARTDFNLLEAGELAALTDQLEHLLLVELPGEEIPEKTRLSFAATRLVHIAECRLANGETLAMIGQTKDKLVADLSQKGLAEDKRRQLELDLSDVTKALKSEGGIRKRETDRTFQLLRKVLRDRPDRVRLWARAVLMCRLTGVRGLQSLFDDIRKVQKKNPLAAEYLYSNMLGLLGAQILIGARILRDDAEPRWRKEAARAFLEDVQTTGNRVPVGEKDRWFMRVSWFQYCFGVYCADLVLRDETTSDQVPKGLSFPRRIKIAGKNCLVTDNMKHTPAEWAWWAGRMSLRQVASNADGMVRALGNALESPKVAAAFWRSFPLDAPVRVLRFMARETGHPSESLTLGGWWYDALRGRPEAMRTIPPPVRTGGVGRACRLLSHRRRNAIPLYDWVEYLLAPTRGITDPRTGEWTALEILRQIAILLGKEPMFIPYLKAERRGQERFPWIHPANFMIPRPWIEIDEPTWLQWSHLVRGGGGAPGVTYAPKSYRIVDKRYTPLSTDNSLFTSVNPVRGLGILLYGLLRKSFDLPALWNGPGHAAVLGMLPKLLLAEMTCSSWTLGVLQGCLQPRATENLFLKGHPLAGKTDDDTLRDPISFLDAKQVTLGACRRKKPLTLRHFVSTPASACGIVWV